MNELVKFEIVKLPRLRIIGKELRPASVIALIV